MKKLFSFLMILLLLCPLSAMAFAEAPQTAADELRSCDLGDVDFVTDLYGLLTKEEEQALENKAAAISRHFGCGVYIIVLDDFTRYSSSDLYTTAGDIFLATDLGLGEEKAGMLLILSMADRDVGLITDEAAHRIVNPDGKDWLAPKYLRYLRQDRWYEAMDAYLENTVTLMEMAEEGKPMTALTTPGARRLGWIFAVPLGFLLAMLVMNRAMRKLKTVYQANSANDYVDGSVDIRFRADVYSHSKENCSYSYSYSNSSSSRSSDGFSSGGSREVDSRGFSGRTDKF